MKHNSIKNIPKQGVSHNPAILKQVMLNNGEIPQITTFAQAEFQPGQSVAEHIHETMYEVFYILKGKADFIIEDQKITVKMGDYVVIEPKERHSQANLYAESVSWLYFAVASS